MSDGTHIEWTDATWNPVTGCTKVSQGCKHCYAERDWQRLSANASTVYFGRPFTDVRCHPERLDVPFRWSKPRRIFVNSMSDLFHEAVPDEFVNSVFAVMAANRKHIFQVLTKRTARMRQMMIDHADEFGPPPAPNIHLGISAENQITWDERIVDLLATPAAARFVSLEPLLGSIDGRGRTSADSTVSVPRAADWPIAALDWVIVGGESGPRSRPTNPRWVRWIRDQCDIAQTPFFFKQWGDWFPSGQMAATSIDCSHAQMHNFDDGNFAWRVGKKKAGRQLDGRHYDGQPRA